MAGNCQQAERISNIINTKKSTPRHIIIKLLKTEDKGKKNLKSGERKMTLLTGQRSTNYGSWRNLPYYMFW